MKKMLESKHKKSRINPQSQQIPKYTNPPTLSSSIVKARFYFTRPTQSTAISCTWNTHTFCVRYRANLDESIAPLLVLNYVLNPFDMVWYWTSFGLYSTIFWFTPRVWYFASFKYYPAKLFLLRGGRVLKVETQSVGADRFTYWA